MTLDQMEQLAQRARQGQLEPKEMRALQAQLDLLVQQGQPDPRVLQVLQDLRAARVQLDQQVLQDHKEI